MKKTFKDILKEAPKPKKLTLDERLPHIFDTLWDAKNLRQLYHFEKTLSAQHLRLLRESGYDTTDLPRLNMITCSLCGNEWEDVETCVEDNALDHESFDRIDDDEESTHFTIECCKCTGKKCSWQ